MIIIGVGCTLTYNKPFTMTWRVIVVLLVSTFVGGIVAQLSPQGDLNTLGGGAIANSQPWPGYQPAGYPSPNQLPGYNGYPPSPFGQPAFGGGGGNGLMGLFSNPLMMAYWMHNIF